MNPASDAGQGGIDVPLRILHVEDDADFAELFGLKMGRISLQMSGPLFDITTVDSAKKAIEAIDTTPFSCIVSDYQLCGDDGLSLLDGMSNKSINIPIIFLTGQGDENVARNAFVRGASDYFTKDIRFAGYEKIYHNAFRGRAQSSQRPYI